MPSVLERRLIVVTGKGGVGKTTLAAALGLLAARRGLRTIVVELSGADSDAGAAGRLAALLDDPQAPEHGVETQLAAHLWGLSIDRDRVLAEWLRALGGRVPARVLTSSASFQYLIAAAPGAREMLSMVKIWELAQGRRPEERRAPRQTNGAGAATAERSHAAASFEYSSRGDYDLVVLDAPATGHALALLRSPQLFSAIARVGPIARQARQVRELFEDPSRSAYLGVAHATEMATAETIELQESLRSELGRELDAVVINGSLPRRFEGAELRRIAASSARRGKAGLVTAAATRAAHAVHERARAQQGQIARLRRRGVAVLTVPFSFQAELDLAAVQRIADRLERTL
jgi:anion-transporting  ArsA/GET3 family ATPase